MAKLNRKLHMGMVGGGPGAFIGEVHHKAAVMDGQVDLVAGAFSSDPKKSAQKGEEIHTDPKRAYPTYEDMIKGELALPEGERVDFVSVVTPNHLHFPVAKAFLEAGFHVICDKPMALNVDEARQLKELVAKSGKVFALTHNYTGYPMVKLAKHMVHDGELGTIRKVIVQYPQGWLSLTPKLDDSSKKEIWRTDPSRSGAAGCIGDIGTHAENLAEYITGLRIESLCADLHTFIPGGLLDDDGNVLLRFEGGARGLLHASQIANGEENGLAIWVYGDKKGLEWHQENPNYLRVKRDNAPEEVWKRGNSYISERCEAAGRAMRIPFGHPEGFIEAFANVYVNATDTIRAAILGDKPTELELDFPTVDDGLRGMLFIDTVVKSAGSDQKWTSMPKE